MAKYGASYLYFAPFAETDPDTNAAKLPKYGTKVHLGSLITVAETRSRTAWMKSRITTFPPP